MDTFAPTMPEDGASSERFLRKRDRILDAAATIMNDSGLKSMTFAAVAEAVGLNTTSVTYYFKRKDLLAAAAIERTIDVLAEQVETAGRAETPDQRVAALLRSYLFQAGEARLGRDRPMALLSDLRAQNDPHRERLSLAHLERVLRPTARFFGDCSDPLNRARAFVMMDTLYWSRAWLPQYSVGDYERIGKRLMELLTHGILPDGATWNAAAPARTPKEESPRNDISPETYLHAATRLINERGYRGASVERIAGELNVSKGSFYHHLQGKDDLVLECFQRSYGRFSQAQRQAINLPGSHRDRLAACLGDLLDIQFEASFPLLRITALQALPTEMRRTVIARSNRMAVRFAGMISDGIAEGSIRPVDPLIASQWVTGLMNSAHDMRFWAAEQPDRDHAIALYSHCIAHGLFAPR
ncbi:MAG: TetR/AcrR family transcriptional regulator [Pseudooceanicola sp.]